ncbi:MAG: thiamine phosphate synthase [Acidobacteriia bacterium]|nr:thiamine phosphate synthase [Terriglobia bacterium]
MRLEKLYAILDPSVRSELSVPTIAARLLKGGARWIQYRNKFAAGREMLADVATLVRAARAVKARIVVNDRADVAWLARAHGVHVGQSDLNVRQVRQILGPRKMVGISTHDLDQALAAANTSATYIALGPIFPTTTKKNPDPTVGLEGLREIRKYLAAPIVAIGGITADNAADVIAAGADSVAVISDLLRAEDISERTRLFLKVLGK